MPSKKETEILEDYNNARIYPRTVCVRSFMKDSTFKIFAGVLIIFFMISGTFQGIMLNHVIDLVGTVTVLKSEIKKLTGDNETINFIKFKNYEKKIDSDIKKEKNKINQEKLKKDQNLINNYQC